MGVMVCLLLESIVERKPKAIEFDRENSIGDKHDRFTDQVELNDPGKMQRKYNELHIITDDLPFNHQVQNERKKFDEVPTYRLDYGQQQPDVFGSAEKQAQLLLALEESQIEKAMCETLGDYVKKQLQARCSEDLSKQEDSESDFDQNEENQNLVRLKLNEAAISSFKETLDKYFGIDDNVSLSSAEKIFQTPKRKMKKIFHVVNPHQQDTDEEVAKRLQQELNMEIEKSDEKLASELRDEEIARGLARNNRATKMSRGAMKAEITAKFETEFAKLHKKSAKDNENFFSEAELEDMDFSDFSYNEIESEPTIQQNN